MEEIQDKNVIENVSENELNKDLESPILDNQPIEKKIEEKIEKKEEEVVEDKEIKKRIRNRYSDIDRETAFWYLYKLGEGRSLPKVSKKYNIPLWVVKEWSRQEKWQDRIDELEETVREGKGLEKEAGLLSVANLAIFSVCMKILKSENASASEKLKAADKLEEINQRRSEIKDYLKVSIKLESPEKVKEVLRQYGFKIITDT